MIAYFDTSAVVPLLIDEPWSSRASSLWDEAQRVVSVRLVYPEARAALARARRLGRVTAHDHRAAVAALDALYEDLDLVDVEDALAKRAGDLAETLDLRGYDAVHLAAAEQARDADLVVVAGDVALLRAASAVGLTVAQLS